MTKRKMKVMIVAIVCSLVLFVFLIRDQDSLTRKQLNVCRTIQNEKIRADCVVRVSREDS